MLNFEVTEVPEELKNYYEPVGDVFRLKVTGVVTTSAFEEQKSKINEFRANNVELKKKVEQLSQFEQMFQSGDFSSDKINSKVETLALERAAQMKQTYEQQIKELTDGLNNERTILSSRVLSDEVKSAAMKQGVSDTAIEDVLARAKGAFKVEGGNLVAADNNLDAKGNKVTLDSWMANLAVSATHLFAASKGTGAAKPARAESVSTIDTISRISAGLAKLKN